MKARIYKPARTAMQSGTRRTKLWRLEFEPQSAPTVEPLMGWTSSTETTRQVRLEFASREEALAYAQKQGLTVRVDDEKTKRERTVAYADNFRADRAAPWTH